MVYAGFSHRWFRTAENNNSGETSPYVVCFFPMGKNLETRMVVDVAEIALVYRAAGRGELPKPVDRDIYPFMHEVEFICRTGEYATLTVQQSYRGGTTHYFLSLSSIQS